jgi:hypothetical protein
MGMTTQTKGQTMSARYTDEWSGTIEIAYRGETARTNDTASKRFHRALIHKLVRGAGGGFADQVALEGIVLQLIEAEG